MSPRRHQMTFMLSSVIMRTTVDIDDPILREVKAIHETEGRSMGAVVSELLADALARRRSRTGRERPAFRWTSRPMKALVDLADKDALHAALDGDRS
jgi:Arc/MetJ family transcription regulator